MAHGGGDCCDHDHGHSHQEQQQQQQQGLPPPPTAEQTALSDAYFKEVKFDYDEKTGNLSSPTHDFTLLNAIAKSLQSIPPQFVVPPPPNVLPPQRSMAITQAKDRGVAAFKKKDYAEAIREFTLAVDVSASRPLWEAAQVVRDELAVNLNNRSATFAAVEDWVNSLVDAEAVVQLKKPWFKGHYRKGLALSKLGRYQEARDAYLEGLQFDPESVVGSSSRASMAKLDARVRSLTDSHLACSSSIDVNRTSRLP